MTQPVVEIVTFKLVEGVKDTAFLDAAHAASDYVKGCSGFVRRHLSKGEDGQWIDYLEWESMEDAQKASETFTSQESLHTFMAYIDGPSVKMHHNHLLHQSLA